MRHDPAAGAIVIMLRSLKMYGMAQAVTDLIEQGALDIHAGEFMGLVVETQCNYFAPLAFPQTVEAGSIDLLSCYVANGYGFGVNIALESVTRQPGVRVLPLVGFEPITMGLVWRGEPSPVVRTCCPR